nr:hypothetical protein [Vibrio alginolyticus]
MVIEYIYSALEFIANIGQTFLDFFDVAIEWIKNAFEYGAMWLISVWLDIKIASTAARRIWRLYACRRPL